MNRKTQRKEREKEGTDEEFLSFNRYNSKVKRVNIPIPSFEYVHKSWFSNRLGDATPGFLIGRDRIIEKLKAWLTKEKTDGGSYLVTGYRGMGKTCFVDRVLYGLVGEANWLINVIGFVCLMILAYCIYEIVGRQPGGKYEYQEGDAIYYIGAIVSVIVIWATCKFYLLKEIYKKCSFRVRVTGRYMKRKRSFSRLWAIILMMI